MPVKYSQINFLKIKHNLLYPKFILVFLSIAYLIQLTSPLRLTPDVVVYLSMADSFIKEGTFLYQEQPSGFPYGYPFLIALLDFLKLGDPFGFILLNLIFLALGNIFAFKVIDISFNIKKDIIYFIIIITLLSFVFIRNVTWPLSDIVYYGFSMAAIFLFSSYENHFHENSWLTFIFGILISLIAIKIRRIGIVFIPAIIILFLKTNLFSIKYRKTNFLIILVLFSSLTIFSLKFLIFNSGYFNSALMEYKSLGGLAGGFYVMEFRLRELGEIMLNMPSSFVLMPLKSAISLLGLVMLFLLLGGVIRRKGKIIFVDVYFILYCLILLVWPYYDARFWLPILPFVFCYIYIYISSKKLPEAVAMLLTVYLIIFFTIGLLGIGYTTRLSLSGKKFPELYCEGLYLKQYHTAYGLSESNNGTFSDWDKSAINVLRRYGL